MALGTQLSYSYRTSCFAGAVMNGSYFPDLGFPDDFLILYYG